MIRSAISLLACAATLGCQSTSPATPEQIQRMAVSESGFERERAVALMISDYRSEYLDELVACARDVDVSVRRAVYRRIHETKDREFIAPLQEILNSASDIDDRKLLTEALARLRSLPVDTPVPQAPR